MVRPIDKPFYGVSVTRIDVADQKRTRMIA